MGALVGLVGIGLLLVWSAFTMPRTPSVARPVRLARHLPRRGGHEQRVRPGRGAPQPRARCRGRAGGPGRVGDTAGGAGLRRDGRVLPVRGGRGPGATAAARVRGGVARGGRQPGSAVRAGMSLPDALAALCGARPGALRPAFDAFALDYQVTGRFGECLDRLKDELADPVGDRVVEVCGSPARSAAASSAGCCATCRATCATTPAPAGDGVATGLDRQRRPAGGRRPVAGAADHVLPVRRDPSLRLAAGVVVLAVGASLCVAAYWLMMRIGRLPVERRILR